MNNPSSPRHGPVAPNGASDAAAALRGASLAFSNSSKPKPAPPPPPKHLDVRSNALSAATTSASRERSRSRSPAPPQSRQTTGGSFRPSADQHFGRDGAMDGASIRDRMARLGASSPIAPTTPTTRLQPSSAGGKPTSYDLKNPSFIAATLAASRTASPSPQNKTPSPAHQPAAPNMRALAAARGRQRRESLESSSMSSIELPDTSSLAPTTSLISMFEGAPDLEGDHADPIKKSPARTHKKALSVGSSRIKPPLRPMTPERSISPKEEATPTRAPKEPMNQEPPSPLRTQITPRAKPKPKPKPKPQAGIPSVDGTAMPTKPGPPVAPKPSTHVSPPQPSRVKQDVQASEVVRASYLPHRPGSRKQAQSVSPPRKPVQPKISKIGTMDLDPGLVASRTPQEPITGNREDAARTLPKAPAPKPAKLRSETAEATHPAPKIVRSCSPQVVSPQPTRAGAKPKLSEPPTPPQPRGAGGRSKQPTTASSNSATADARPTTSSTTSSNDTFVSASSGHTPRPPSPPPRREPIARPSSAASVPVGSPTRPNAPLLPRRHPATQSSSNLPLNSLSNAIMAGSLAASRLTPSNTGTSTRSLGPVLPPRRGKSPRLRQTLRKPVVSEDEEAEARRIKKHHGHHSNKKHFHHEGARKRWREEIKPAERKRYEALWASNRGVLHEYLPPTSSTSTDTVHLTAGKDAIMRAGGSRPDLADYVLNIVVREIWRRSRLPEDELGEVWDLVAGHQTKRQAAGPGGGSSGSGSASPVVPPGMLGKQQFVVGTWIIDQRLRGRKIPARISASVWDSAKGVRVSSPKAGREGGRKVRK